MRWHDEGTVLAPRLGYSGIMPEVDTQILVVGGGSRIARSLIPLLRNAAIFVRRCPMAGQVRDFVVNDYDTIPPDIFRGVRCVINCVGVSRGSAAELKRINVELPRRWAKAAKVAGVHHIIHISSFSVYGGAHTIDRDTMATPVSDYGRSKLAADEELLGLADEHFRVSILRLPLVYGGDSLGKLGQLLLWWERMRVLPIPVGDVSRAMIGVELSAEVIAQLCWTPHTGIVFAADPQPFTYTEAARSRGRRLFRLSLPRVMTSLVARVVPTLGRRLFADSRLAEADNLAIRYGLASRLLHDMATISFQ